MQPWLFIQDKLNKHIPVVLLYVLESQGSSPGRQGFKMAVASDGSMQGSIGGGIMKWPRQYWRISLRQLACTGRCMIKLQPNKVV